ncbi:MAG TPA: hypothetical protein QF604_02530 [Candidatus Latescibacteria bacterium]|nr:hypothetical protein [Candidatus Latescibacterota bacterium]
MAVIFMGLAHREMGSGLGPGSANAIKCLKDNDAEQRPRRLAVIEALVPGGATPATALDGRTVAGVVAASGDEDLRRSIEG